MRIHALSAAAAILTLPSHAYAGAWTQEQGAGQVILTGLYYRSDQFYTNSGHKQALPNYSKYELNPYMEYGLCNAVTIGANLLLQRAHQNAAPGGTAHTNWGIGDSEFFVRTRLWRENGLVVSAEPMLKLPSPASGNDLPRLGGSYPDAGLGISVGYSFQAYGQQHYANLSAQYRYRFGHPQDQVNFAATLGLGLHERWTLMPQVFLTYRVKEPAVAAFTQSSGDDYNLVKLQLSAVYRASDDLSLQLGGFSHADGKNAGAGEGVLFAIWKRF